MIESSPIGRGRSRRLVVPALAAAALLALAACGDGAAAPATGGDTSPDQLQQARDFTAEAATVPTAITITKPLKAKPTPGQTLVFLQGTDTVSKAKSEAVTEAAAAVGWTVKILRFDNSDPATQVSAMQSALQFSPVAVFAPGTDPALWAASMPGYEANDVPVITATLDSKSQPHVSSPVVQIETEKANDRQGEILANWFIDASGGKGNALVVSLPTYPLFKEIGASFDQTIQSGCPGCNTTYLNLTLPQLAQKEVVPAIIAELRKHPDINYVTSFSGTFLEGLAAQLDANGLTDQVTIGTNLARANTIADMLAGKVAVATNQGELYGGYLIMDAALRLAEGSDLPKEAYEEGPPIVLLNKDNVGEPVPSWNAPLDFREQFEKMWKVR